MNSKYIFSIAFLAGSVSLKAQTLSPEVISSAGDFLTSTAGSVSYTIGEPVSETFSATPNILTQGFQQPFTVSLAGIAEQAAGGEIYAYPNPVKDELLIDFSKLNSGKYSMKILDVAGKEVERRELEIAAEFLQRTSLAKYENGIYFIEIISSDKNFLKTFKIVKQN